MSEPTKHEPIDYFGPGFVMAVILAMGADACALVLIGALIPGVGLAFLAFFMLVHYFASFAIGFLIFPHLKHLVPGLVLLLAMVLPLPLLSIGLFFAVIMQNKFIELAVIEVGVKALEVAEALVPVAGEAAILATETAKTAVEGAEMAGTAAKGAEAVSAGSKAVEGAEGISKGKGITREGLERFRDNYDQQEDSERNDNDENEPDESLGELPSERQKMLRENFPDADTMEEQADMVELGENEVDLRKAA